MYRTGRRRGVASNPQLSAPTLIWLSACQPQIGRHYGLPHDVGSRRLHLPRTLESYLVVFLLSACRWRTRMAALN
ncbi:hypothetical protein CH63R_10935 [Colletotrichum higginsianum IMI 349063]|uniref:Uncharacterized protein n=1 Tax=Colletotrichum higginsianum (strain IMI 349063) TaxID=759273 RepID=A0A1B7Y4A8_COLHI|nr:uncharacterized protein CH63R_10935 [Colletotrichum higginsianum IMI 349063]OBR06815.1 hypothetical protein CH63R_10935 [Colletotrichum higginsianum IMI 349063]